MIKDEEEMVKDERGTLNLLRAQKSPEGMREDVGRGRSRCSRSLIAGLWSLVRGSRSRVSVLAVLLVVAGSALAQPAQSQAPTFKYYAWGQVRSPGAYVLGVSPDLMELLSAAGGPTQYANVRRVVLIRSTTQQREIINLKTMMFSGQVVSLSPGDIVIVPNSAWYFIREYMSVTATLVSFATLIFTVMNWVAR